MGEIAIFWVFVFVGAKASTKLSYSNEKSAEKLAVAALNLI